MLENLYIQVDRHGRKSFVTQWAGIHGMTIYLFIYYYYYLYIYLT